MAAAVWRYAAPDEGALVLRLESTQGPVRLERPDQGEIPSEEGAELGAADRLVTGQSGRATLMLGRETEIRVRPDSSVEVLGVDEAGVTLELDRGALTATVRPNSGAVRVGNQGREVLAVHGDIEVGVEGEVMQVRSLEGEAAVSGANVTRVPEGEEAILVGHRGGVGPIPEELLLAVAWPDSQERTRAAESVVLGASVPGAEVVVTTSLGEFRTVADSKGAFRLSVPLDEGGNQVEVRATDPLGHEALVTGRLEHRDTRAPLLRHSQARPRSQP